MRMRPGNNMLGLVQLKLMNTENKTRLSYTKKNKRTYLQCESVYVKFATK